jgi:hypothetical protein
MLCNLTLRLGFFSYPEWLDIFMKLSYSYAVMIPKDLHKESILHLFKILRNEEGAVAIIFAFVLVFVMIPILALSIDMGGGVMMASEMQNAASAASIASAMENADKAEAQEYFEANLPVDQHSINYDFGSDVAVTLNADNTVSVIPTNFERPAFFAPAITPQGFSVIKASSLSVASLPEGAIVPTNFAFVLDKSGSMREDTSSPLLGGGTVPRTTAVAQAFDLIMRKVKAAPQAADNYSVAVSAFSSNVRQPDKFDFTNDFDQAVSDVYNIMQPYRNTCGACGISEIKNYLPTAPGNNRRIVFVWMTDGGQNVPYEDNPYPPPPCPQAGTYGDGDGYIPPNPLPGGLPPFVNVPIPEMSNACTKQPNDYAAAECQLIRNIYPDVEMWTIGFGSGSQVGQNLMLLDFCASDPSKHIYADNGADLGQIFNQIITQAIGARLRR